MVIAREEIFGPVLCVMKADTFDEAVAIVKKHELGNASEHLHHAAASTRASTATASSPACWA